MKKKYKIIIGIVLGILIFGSIIYFIFRAKNYEKVYRVAEFEITEKFDKNNKYYKFSLKKDGSNFENVIFSKYIGKKLIDDVSIIENEEKTEECILFKSGKLKTYPQCKNSEGFIDYDLTSIKSEDYYVREELEVIESKHDKAKFYQPVDLKFLVWDNVGYIYVDKNEKKDIHFLKNESYYNNFSWQVGKYVLTPDYDEDYVFSSFYIFDMEKGKLSTWKLDEEISQNFYYLGSKDNKVYLVDRKNKREFSLNPRTKKMELVSHDDEGIIWNNDWETVSLTKLTSDNYYFSNEKMFDYYLENDNIYLKVIDSKNGVKLSNKKVDKLIATKDDMVFYLVKDKLYGYSTIHGEILLAEYSEWNFNNINSIYVY